MLAGSYPPLALPDFAIVGGTLWTMETEAPIRGATLLIADGVVEAVATDLEHTIPVLFFPVFAVIKLLVLKFPARFARLKLCTLEISFGVFSDFSIFIGVNFFNFS